jgi:hypothetical protein
MTINEKVKNPELTAWDAKLATATTWEDLSMRNPSPLPYNVGEDPKFPFVMGSTTDYGETFRFDEYAKIGNSREGQPEYCGDFVRKRDSKHIILKYMKGVGAITTTPELERRDYFASGW